MILLRSYITRLPRPVKRAVMVASDLVILAGAVWAAFALRFGDPLPHYLLEFWWLLIAVPLLTVPVFYLLGLYRAVVRYMGPQALLAVLKGVTLSTLMVGAVVLLVNQRSVPRSIIVLYWLLALFGMESTRFLARVYLRGTGKLRLDSKEAVVLYGAGATGVQSAAALLNGNEYEPVAFVDDDRRLHGSVMHGVRVFAPSALQRLVDEYAVGHVLLAMPSVARSRRRHIIESLESLPVHVKTLPGLGDFVSGAARVDEFREVGIEDLLGRDPVAPDPELLQGTVCGKAVMVTGAGGSIGSELCRQIALLQPRVLLLCEQTEFALYRIERELCGLAARQPAQFEVVPLLGSVTDQPFMTRIMRAWGVQTVYHAAAYKHVPLVEHNTIGGVRNNVLGTWYAAEAALEAGVETFVLISTDKAVRPTNVMGASKRFAELVLQGLTGRLQTKESGGTTFCMVRFGNVLGSSGSVVPLFRDQIRKGGPVTVTHPEITRYFMMIPEAAALVLQASSMARGGDVFVLDMGQPVKILEMAKRMIRLAGCEMLDEEHPEGDIDIEFIGLRPGEKLYEELLIGDNVTGTSHPMIMRAEETFHAWPRIARQLQLLDGACVGFDCETLRNILLETVSGFNPIKNIHDLVWQKSHTALPDLHEADRASKVRSLY